MSNLTDFRSRLLRPFVAGFAVALIGVAAFVPSTAHAAPLPGCSGIASLLLENADVLAATSAVQAASGGHLSYCLVDMTVSDLAGPTDGYLPGQKQMIGIAIGLPLSAADSGSGGVEGNWNGRIQNLGGGGYQGFLSPVTPATDFGYAGSNTDTGHTGNPAVGGFPFGPLGDATWALNPDGTLNWGLINDFAFNAIHEQTTWTKKLVNVYYGTGPLYTYWNGCSTGGRQGHEQAQRFPDDYDGILAGAPAFNWDRFIPAEEWGEIVMHQELVYPISQAKLDAVSVAATAACAAGPAGTGLGDGIIQDPRACTVDASEFVCGTPGGAALAPNCLTSEEAGALDKIWTGPPGFFSGPPLWFGLERGTYLDFLDANTSTSIASPPGAGEAVDAPFLPFDVSNQHLAYWVFQDPNFNPLTLTETTFDFAFLLSELKFRDVIGTDNPELFAFQARGGKMIIYHGLADELIFPRGSYNYYNAVTNAMGGLSEVQSFYRFFPYPGNGHCGVGPTFQGGFGATVPAIDSSTDGALFQALVDWVEHNVAPDTITAANSTGGTRLICKYPDTLHYNGSGNIFAADNFTCETQKRDPLMRDESALPDLGRLGP